jgi:hypothetical protein
MITGLGTIGVALEPLGTHVSDGLHVGFAATAYASLAMCPLVASEYLNGRKAQLSAWTGIFIGIALIIAFRGPVETHGLFQRIGLTIGDIWFTVTAFAVLVKPELLKQTAHQNLLTRHRKVNRHA